MPSLWISIEPQQTEVGSVALPGPVVVVLDGWRVPDASVRTPIAIDAGEHTLAAWVAHLAPWGIDGLARLPFGKAKAVFVVDEHDVSATYLPPTTMFRRGYLWVRGASNSTQPGRG